MIDILLAGVGGQGTVLAAKVLAQAAQSRGWQVRTAETIGMAQRGGNVTSHVRMGSGGEEVFSPLITPGTADMVIALEPGEAARALPGINVSTSARVKSRDVARFMGSPFLCTLRNWGRHLFLIVPQPPGNVHHPPLEISARPQEAGPPLRAAPLSRKPAAYRSRAAMSPI